jgi:hypothetical protein
MNDSWYDMVAGETPIAQGDLIPACPLLSWKLSQPYPAGGHSEAEFLEQSARAFRADVVVMTQACDLEHDKVSNVVLCPHTPLSTFHRNWETAMQALTQNPTAKAWKNTCQDIADGHVWNHTFLNKWVEGEAHLQPELRVVEFRELFTIPRGFLQELVNNRKEKRLRLRSPYREHLSQAFARFFMRVGLPQPVEKDW